MTLTALLVCVDEAAAQVLRRVLEELRIRVESCPDFCRASLRLAQDRFDAVIVDGESNADVITLLRDTCLSRTNDATLAIALVSGQESIREMFSLGVNFVLYKPVAYDRALSSLRAARAVMRKEKRKSARASVHAHATVDYANVQQEKATLVDVAQDGMSVRFGKKLPPVGKVYFTFQLPGQSSSVRLSGQLIWQDWNGRAGVQFVDVPKASRRMLNEFLDANLTGESQQERLPDVTVEMEEPFLVSTVATMMKQETHSTDKSSRETTASREATPAVQTELASERPDSDNRRAQKRYALPPGRGGLSAPGPPGSQPLLLLRRSGVRVVATWKFPCHFCQLLGRDSGSEPDEMKLRLRGAGAGIASRLRDGHCV